MTRDELEAAIWRALRPAGSLCASSEQVDAILRAADAYATYTGGITASRRAELDVAVPAAIRSVHFRVRCPIHDDGTCTQARGCNRNCWTAADLLTTTVVRDVTCQRCRRGVPYLEALAQEVAAR